MDNKDYQTICLNAIEEYVSTLPNTPKSIDIKIRLIATKTKIVSCNTIEDKDKVLKELYERQGILITPHIVC